MARKAAKKKAISAAKQEKPAPHPTALKRDIKGLKRFKIKPNPIEK